MTEHTKTDGMPAMDGVPDLQFLERSAPRNERMAGVKVECPTQTEIVIKGADRQRTEAMRIAHRNQPVIRHQDQ